MRFVTLLVAVFAAAAAGQDAPQPLPRGPETVTVPLMLDHNRVVINAEITLPDGSAQRVRAWIDNGNPDLLMSRRVATVLGLNVTCGDQSCSAPPPEQISIGGMKIGLAAAKQAKIPLKPADAASVLVPGLSAEINIPSTVLRNYAVLIDLSGHEFTIGQPGKLQFKGVKSKAIVDSQNGLIEIPSEIEKKKYNLALDLGSSISVLGETLFDQLAAAHPEWPHMTGAVGPANMWGTSDELNARLLRVERLQFGPLFLTGVPAMRPSPGAVEVFGKRAGLAGVGVLGTEALMNYRVGIDYAHSAVYFDIGRLFNFPDFDVIGLILRPEDDGKFTVLGVADYNGKPSISVGPDGVQPGDHLVAVDGISTAGSTLGQVWLMLGGVPGKTRTLTVERGGKQFSVAGRVQRFLEEREENKDERQYFR